MRPLLVLALSGMLWLCAPSGAMAGSSFRMMRAEPHPKGATVTLAVKQSGATNKVTLFVSNQPQSDWHRPEGADLGVHDLPTGECKVMIDYAKAGLKAGDKLYMAGKWGNSKDTRSGHCWGLAAGSYKSRSSGSLVLPGSSSQTAKANSALGARRAWPTSWTSRAAAWAPRWSPARGRPGLRARGRLRPRVGVRSLSRPR